MSTDTPETTTVTTTAAQALRGAEIGLEDRVVCFSCGTERRAGASIRVYAYRMSDEAALRVVRVTCADCCVEETVAGPTLGACEVLADVGLVTQSDPGRQRHRLAVGEVDVLDHSPATEGHSP